MRVVEMFSSIQGEGPMIGHPSLFIRLFGCNFTCSGFSRPEATDQDSNLIPVVDLAGVTDVRQLDGDSFTVGCDSRYSWAPEYEHLSKPMTGIELAEGISDGTLLEHDPHGMDHPSALVLTGGEPLMHQHEIAAFIRRMIDNGYAHGLYVTHITFETNGSVPILPVLADALMDFLDIDPRMGVLFSNSPKLEHSGEPLHKRFKAGAVVSQVSLVNRAFDKYGSLRIASSYKYVVATAAHMAEARDLHIHRIVAGWVYMRDTASSPSWPAISRMLKPCAMPLGASYEQYRENERAVADMCQLFDFRFSPRLHLHLYGNAIGT